MTSVHFITSGCSANSADTEQMAGLLKQAKFDIIDNVEDADILIYNTCTVKTPTENNFFRHLEALKKQHPYKIFIIAGCIAQADRKKLAEYSLIGTKQIHNIVEVVEESLNDNVVKALETGEMPPLNLPKVRKNPIVEIIPINRGCASFCTFCKTKQARGNLKSYTVKDILHVTMQALNEGVKEIWLTSQDTFCYGFDIDTNLPTLLGKLTQLPGNFKIRVGMGNPVHLVKIKDELFPLFNHPKVFKFIHIPMQAGGNKVLEQMKRGNTNEEFVALVQEVQQLVPNITIATDVIVGFPEESDEDFWETINTIRKVTPDVINISKFWARPNTPAAKMKQVPSEVIKKRGQVITDIFHNISRMQNEKWIGWEGDILIDEEGREGQMIGRNNHYKQVIVEGQQKIGDRLTVKIRNSTTFDLRGLII
jgi:threonylcarbamoyladenosine tRNA methylthiotransferase CDKAL1